MDERRIGNLPAPLKDGIMIARSMNAFTTFIERLRLLSRSLIYTTELLASNSKANKGKKVLVNVKNGAGAKYFATLILFFLQPGYQVSVRFHLKFIASLWTFRKLLKDSGEINGTLASTKFDIVVTDDDNFAPACEKLFRTSFEYFANVKGIVLPYPMSPKNYEPKVIGNLESFRNQKKTIGIYFSGNQDPDTYDSSIIKDKFKKVNRVKMIQFLKSNLSPDILTSIEKSEIADNELKHKVVVAEWSWTTSKFINANLRTNDADWLAQLGKSNFFLALPGMVMPMCHNAIESMAVGTIPILEYAEEFYPPLKHGINSIVYSGEEDAIEKIRFALTLPDEALATMRKAVIDYYESHLSPRSFVSKIESLPNGKYTLTMNAEQLSVL